MQEAEANRHEQEYEQEQDKHAQHKHPRGESRTRRIGRRDRSGRVIRVIRGKPGAVSPRCRGTETSAEDLVGPPERMVSERRSTPPQQWY